MLTIRPAFTPQVQPLKTVSRPIAEAPRFSGISRHAASGFMMAAGLVGFVPSAYWGTTHLQRELKPAIQAKVEGSVDTAVDRAVDNSDEMIKQLAHMLLEKTSEKMQDSKEAVKEKAANFFKKVTGHGDEVVKKPVDPNAPKLELGMMLHELKEKDLNGLVDVILHEGSSGKASDALKEKLKVILKTNIKTAMAKQKDKPAVFDETYDQIFAVLRTEGAKAGITPFLCLAMFMLGGILNRLPEKK